MNAPHTMPRAPRGESVPASARSDREFLPAALSILETPPSPVRIALIWAIALLVVFAIGWSYFGRIDIVAVAQGKIQPTGRVKTVQPVEPGRVAAIRVENGRSVRAGQTLVELDGTEARAEETAARDALADISAEALRRRAALAAAEARAFDGAPGVAWPDDIPEDARRRQARVLRADLTQLATTARAIDAQIRQKEAEVERLTETIAAQQALVATLRERVAMRTQLNERNAAPRAAVIDALETLQTQETALSHQKGQLGEARSAIAVLHVERARGLDAFIAETAQKLAEAERQIEEQRQRLAKARVRVGHMTIESPIDGVVIGLSVTTVGQVVAASEEIMRIVPDGAGIEIECYVQNKDAGFVKVGQTAVVKIESFPFTRYGSVEGRVTRVSHDAIPEPDAQTIEGAPSRSTRSSYFAGAQRVQNLVFPVSLQLDRAAIRIGDADAPLTPGMAVTVEIRTGARRILEYVFSPLVETASKALKER